MSSLGTAFSTQGPTPFGAPTDPTTTPSTRTAPGLFQQLGLGSANSNLPIINSPSTPLKSTVITDASGNTVQHNYHAPEIGNKPGLINSTSSASNAGAYDAIHGTGAYNAYIKQNGSAPSSNSNQSTSQNISQVNNQPVNPIPTTPTFPGLVTNLASQNTTPYNAMNTTSITGLNNSGVVNGQLGQNAEDIANAAGTKIADIGTQAARGQAGYLTTGTAPVAEGNAAVLANTAANQQQAVAKGAEAQLAGNAQALTAQGQTQSGLTNAGTLANTGQQNNQTALNNAAGYAAPQPYALNTQPYNPLTDTYGGGATGGAINRAVTASNIASAGDFQSKIQSTQALANSADANFDILNSYATQGGVDNNSPIISKLRQLYGQTVGGQDAPAVQSFLSQLQSVRAAYQNLTGATDANTQIPDNITPAGLTSIQNSLRDTVKNNITGYQKQLNSLGGTSSSGGTYRGYNLPYSN